MNSSKIPLLQERFLQPIGWHWHSFRHENRDIRFGFVSPQGGNPDAAVIGLPGLSEFSEKYFEIARNCLERNLEFWVIDWAGQGKSGRFIENSQKRHSQGYQHDIDALHAFIMDYAGKPVLPRIMLAHSMGGNIGLRYLAQHPGIFECAAFSAPLLGLKVFEHVPNQLAGLITKVACYISDTAYLPGFGDWRENVRSDPAINFYSGDAARNQVHNAWCLTNPELQVGGVTYGWLHETQKSCMALWEKGVLQSIETPSLMALAGRENFVSNTFIRKAAALMPHVKLLEFPEARHEILMESDNIRKTFLGAFFELINARKQG